MLPNAVFNAKSPEQQSAYLKGFTEEALRKMPLHKQALYFKQVRSTSKRYGLWTQEDQQMHLTMMKSIYKPQQKKYDKDKWRVPSVQKNPQDLTKQHSDNKVSQPNFFDFDNSPALYKNESEALVAKRKARAAFFRKKGNKPQFPGKNSHTAEAQNKRDFRSKPNHNAKYHNHKFKNYKSMNRTDHITTNFQKRSFHMSHDVLSSKSRSKKKRLLSFGAELSDKPRHSLELLSHFNMHALNNIDIIETLANMQKNKVSTSKKPLAKNSKESQQKLNNRIALSNKNGVHKKKAQLKSNSIGALKPSKAEVRHSSGNDKKKNLTKSYVKASVFKGGAQSTVGVRSAAPRKNSVATKGVLSNQSRRFFTTKSSQKLTPLKKRGVLAFDISKYSKFLGELKGRVTLKERRKLAILNKRRGPRKKTFVRKNGLIPALFRHIRARRHRRASSRAKLFKRVGTRVKTTYP